MKSSGIFAACWAAKLHHIIPLNRKRAKCALCSTTLHIATIFSNRFLSLGIDKSWRKKAVKMLGDSNPSSILDVATGTADFAIECLRLNPDEVIGVDISEGMLEFGRKKLKDKGIDKIKLQVGDSEALQFEDKRFDAVVVGFGVRNFESLETGLKEINRVP